MREYRDEDSDNARWEGFEFRPGDIVIDAPSKSGTTWTQLLVALLIFDGPDFPESIGQMSFWLEQLTRPAEEAHAVFAAQVHRPFVKSHTPLDGVPIVDDVKYVCTGRDPRDAAISMIHQSENLDRERLAELIGIEPGADGAPDSPPQRTTEERLDRWIDGGEFPVWSARFLAHHHATFWERKDLPNVELFHFADYQRDLAREVRRLAGFLEIPIADDRASELAAEASLDRARSRAADIAPEAHMGVWKSTENFFRSGTSGQGRDTMTPGQLERYAALITDLVPPNLAHWMHQGSG